MLFRSAAKALAKCKSGLFLNGVTTLSPEVADALAEYEGWSLSLNGVTTLSDEAAKALAKCKGGLSLNGVTMLSDEAANALAQRDGYLSLHGLTTLTNAQLAAKLAPRLQQVKTLFLVKTFKSLTTLSPEAAQALAQHGEGHLSLDGLTTLSDEVAKALARYKGDSMSLDGLTTLSDEAAKALARYKGRLSLNGRIKLSPKARAALRANPSLSNKF